MSYGNYNKNQNKNQITAHERMEAEAALRSLKQKIANAPKKPANKPAPQTYKNAPSQNYNQMNYGMSNNNYNYNQPQKKTQPPKSNNLRSKPQNNFNNNYGNVNKRPNFPSNRGGFGGGFGGGFEDNRPLGGGMTADEMPDENEITTPCPHCGRSFNQIAYPKHVKICQKVFQKKRKAFNTQKQRIIDSEQASLMRQGALEAKRNPKLNKPKGGIPKWKLQSMEFRSICNPKKANQIRKQMGIPMQQNNNLRSGNNKMGAKKGGNNFGYDMGGNDYGYMPSAVPMDYTHCQYCNRNYNEEAYNKHLNGCKRRYEEAQMRNKITRKPVGKVGKPMGNSKIGAPKYGANKMGKRK